MLFRSGGPGDDWLVGATGSNHLYGGWGNDLLDINCRTENPSYVSIAYGGAGRDVLIANNPNDRLIDWSGEFNNYYVPSNNYGLGTVARSSSPQLMDFLYQLSMSDGADVTAGLKWGGNPARNGEPYGELGLVTQQDPASGDQRGKPKGERPGNKSK